MQSYITVANLQHAKLRERFLELTKGDATNASLREHNTKVDTQNDTKIHEL